MSDPKAFAGFFPVVEQQAAGAIPVFQAELAKSPTAREKEAVTEEAKDQLAERQARAAVALVRLGQAGEVWPLLRHSPIPGCAASSSTGSSPLGADPKAIVAAARPTGSSPRHPAHPTRLEPPPGRWTRSSSTPRPRPGGR